MTSHSQNLKLNLNSRVTRALRLLKVLENHQTRSKVKSSTLATKIITSKTNIFDAKKKKINNNNKKIAEEINLANE